MFQQRHFEAIAQMMQDTFPHHENLSEFRVQWHNTRDAMCNLFAQHNPNFMRERFERACEPGANVRARVKGTPGVMKGCGFSNRG